MRAREEMETEGSVINVLRTSRECGHRLSLIGRLRGEGLWDPRLKDRYHQSQLHGHVICAVTWEP